MAFLPQAQVRLGQPSGRDGEPRLLSIKEINDQRPVGEIVSLVGVVDNFTEPYQGPDGGPRVKFNLVDFSAPSSAEAMGLRITWPKEDMPVVEDKRRNVVLVRSVKVFAGDLTGCISLMSDVSTAIFVYSAKDTPGTDHAPLPCPRIYSMSVVREAPLTYAERKSVSDLWKVPGNVSIRKEHTIMPRSQQPPINFHLLKELKVLGTESAFVNLIVQVVSEPCNSMWVTDYTENSDFPTVAVRRGWAATSHSRMRIRIERGNISRHIHENVFVGDWLELLNVHIKLVNREIEGQIGLFVRGPEARVRLLRETKEYEKSMMEMRMLVHQNFRGSEEPADSDPEDIYTALDSMFP